MSDVPVITVDIVSDVVCPWCIIGYKKLEKAMLQVIAEHIAQKYGATAEQSKANRERMRQAGQDLDFEFNSHDQMRMVNTFDAHRLLHWAGETGKQTALKLALFKAHFSDGRNVSDHEVLVEIASSVGLDEKRSRDLLGTGLYAEEVRATEAEWQERFITGVPAFIFNKKFMVPGAQEADVFANIIENKLLQKAA